MPRRTQIFQQLPWSGGINRTVDSGLLPSTDLVAARNVVFALSGARIKRSAHDYFDAFNSTTLSTENASGVRPTGHSSSGTTRKLVFTDEDGNPVSVSNSTRAFFTVGEFIAVTSNEEDFNLVYATAGAKITAISTTTGTNDTVEYELAASESTPATTGDLAIEVTRVDDFIATHDFWYFDAATNLKIQEQIAVQQTQANEILLYKHDASANANRLHIVPRSSQLATATFDGSSSGVVDTSDDEITITSHGWLTADRLIYDAGPGGADIGGLVSGTAYYVIVVDDNTIQLANSHINARDELAIDLTAVGVSGTAHTLTPDTADNDWSEVSGELRVTFLAFNERLIIAFDQPGVLPRIYDPALDSFRLVEGSAPDFFTMTTHFNRIFANDKDDPDRLHYSETGDSDVWNGWNDSGAVDIFPGDGDPVGITTIFPPFKGRLFVAKKSKTYQVVGSAPEDFQPMIISEGLGCEGPLSIAKLDLDDIVYASDKGFHSLAATSSYGDFEGTFLSKKIQPIYDDELNRNRLKYISGAYIPEINSIAFSVARNRGDTRETGFLLYNVELKEWYEWPDLDIKGISVRRVGNLRKVIYATSGSRLVETQRPGFSDFGITAIRYTAQSGTIYPSGNPKGYVGFKKITFYYKPRGRFSFTVTVKIDNQAAQFLSFSQTSEGDALGVDFILGESTLGANNVLAPYTQTIDGYGRGAVITIEQTGTEEQIEIYGFDIEYEDGDTRQETNETGAEQ
jgi:hypothetical protein